MNKSAFLILRAVPYLRLTRPVFLLGGVLYYRLGVQIAIGEGYAVNWAIYWVGQTIVTGIQLAAQYANEYYDQEVDEINALQRTWLTGGSGILQAGQIPAVVALNLAKGFSLLSIALISVFLFKYPSPAFIAIIALIGAWMYSAVFRCRFFMVRR